MVQDQMLQAIAKATNAPGVAEIGAPFLQKDSLGRRQFAAMIWALQNNCQCQACVLLRQELGNMVGDLLQEKPAGGPGNDS